MAAAPAPPGARFVPLEPVPAFGEGVVQRG
jgi:hypothetical protein